MALLGRSHPRPYFGLSLGAATVRTITMSPVCSAGLVWAAARAEYARLYAAAGARRQADQIYNLSLTRTATVILGQRGALRPL
jgi:hypothetical protein